MKKLESNFWNMAMVLTGISIFAAGTLSLVHEATKEPILQAERTKKEEAIRKVTPSFDNSPIQEQFALMSPEGDSLACFPAKKDGKLTGVAILTHSDKGFAGRIEVMVGLRPDGSIYDYSVLKHNETPGLGSKMDEWFRTKHSKHDVLGQNPGTNTFRVSKDGGEVDAITAATISSRAFLDAVVRAYNSYVTTTTEKTTDEVESAPVNTPASVEEAKTRGEAVKKEIHAADTSSRVDGQSAASEQY